MDISNCNGSTSFRLRFFISLSFSAKACSRSATTSDSDSFSSSSISIGTAESSSFSVIFFAMSSSLLMRCAGRHNSCRSVFQRKSSSSTFSFPLCNRVPRPTIWLYKARDLVARRTIMQSTDGQSHPSVRSILLHRTLYFPSSKSLRTSALSWLLPFTSAALKPYLRRYRQNFLLVSTRGKNTTVFRSLAYVTISSAILSRYGSRAVPSSPTL